MKKLSITSTFIFFLVSNMFGQLWTSGTNNLYSNPISTTNVGIGSSSPNSKLQVNAASTGQTAFRVQFGGSTRFTIASNQGVSIGNYNDNPPARGLYVYGNVGIGETSPSAKLHVNAGIGSGIILDLNHSGNWGYGILVHTNQEYTKAFAVTKSDVQKFVIWGNGSVSIGSGVPNTEKLMVDGKISAEEIEVKIINWPDYVFSSEYELPSLIDVENHIKENSHLPDVPSAKEVEEEGLNLGEMNKILLKKVEELTLYTIEQQKMIDKINAEIAEIQNR